MNLTRKQQLFAMVAELHKAGIGTRLCAELLGISREYARQIRMKLGLRAPRNTTEALEQLDSDTREKVRSWQLPTES